MLVNNFILIFITQQSKFGFRSVEAHLFSELVNWFYEWTNLIENQVKICKLDTNLYVCPTLELKPTSNWQLAILFFQFNNQ
jgi:hypothetical protein